MKNDNSMSRAAYYRSSVCWSLFSLLWYHFLVFRPLDGLSSFAARMLSIGLYFLLLALNLTLTAKRQRNAGAIVSNLVLSHGVYTALSYFSIHAPLIALPLAAATLLTLFAVLRALLRPVRQPQHARRIRRQRLARTAAGARALYTLAFIQILIGVFLCNVLRVPVVRSSVEPAAPSVQQTQAPDADMDMLCKLQESEWAALSLPERLDVLQVVANNEANALGLSYALPVIAEDLEEDSIAYYNDMTRSITISYACLREGSAAENLDAVCHEAYHSLEHRMVDVLTSADPAAQSLLFFAQARAYAAEFDHYISGGVDFYTYYMQACEADARAYAQQASADYYARIEAYLVQQAG